MKLDAKRIFELSSKFTGMFFLLAKENDSFLDCLLAFIYSVNTISKIAVKIGVINDDELNKINEALSKAASNDIELTMKTVGPMIETLKKQNWEMKDDDNK